MNEKPKLKLTGENDNAYFVLGEACSLLNSIGKREQAEELFNRAIPVSDTGKILQIIHKYVETVPSPVADPKKTKRKKGKNAHER